MNRSFAQEFRTIDLLLASDCETRGVDAFCLAWIKYERQLRKLVTNLVYQASAIGAGDERALRAAFLNNKNISHNDYRGAIIRLSGSSDKELIGDRYRYLKSVVRNSHEARDKILHGQQTGRSLSRANLVTMTDALKEWCLRLSEAAEENFGYDGFSGKTSLFKTNRPELIAKVDRALKGDWQAFVAGL